MNKIECKRCGMGFNIHSENPFKHSEGTSCVERSCTRRFHHANKPDDKKVFTPYVYQTADDVNMTILGSTERKRSGFKVNNGGCQE